MVRRKTAKRKHQNSRNSRFSRNSHKPIKTAKKRLRHEALKLLSDPKFLARVSETISRIGVVGERRTSLLLFLASLTTHVGYPVSVIVKGPSSSGKSNVVKAVLSLMPPGLVVDRSSLSPKALAQGKVELKGRVLYLAEAQGGQDARFLLRLLQSEGIIRHEYTYVQGRTRGTEVATKEGTPVVITTTTKERLFADDETRFLSVWVDESEKQTLEIAKSLVRGRNFSRTPENLPVMREAVHILLERDVRIELPEWFEVVAAKLPRAVRTRRDFPRFISLVKAVALIQSMSDKRRGEKATEVCLADYAVAYRLSNAAFSRTATESPEIARVCERLYAKHQRPITRKQIQGLTGWTIGLIHKRITKALRSGFLKLAGSGPSNEKRYLPANEQRGDFLPSPKSLVKRHPELGGTKYTDPLSGEVKVISRRKHVHAK